MRYKTGETPQVGDVVSMQGKVVSGPPEYSVCNLEGVVYVDSGSICTWWFVKDVSLVERYRPPVNFETALSAFRKGKQIRRKDWGEGKFFGACASIISAQDAVSLDWEIWDTVEV